MTQPFIPHVPSLNGSPLLAPQGTWLCYTWVKRHQPPHLEALRLVAWGEDYVIVQGSREDACDWADEALYAEPIHIAGLPFH